MTKQTINLSTFLLALTAITLTGCNQEKKEPPPTQLASPPQVAKTPVPASITPASLPAAASSPLPASTPKTTKKIGFAQANGAVNLAQREFDEKNYKLSIVAYFEGFVGHFYPDNIGQAAMFGLNDSLQTKSHMADIARPILTSPGDYTAFVAQAGVHELLPASQPLRFSPEQGIAFVGAMTPQFDNPAKKALGSLYDKLQPNEQAALFYHSYKTGGFSKYAGLVSALKVYAKNSTDANKQAVLSHISYSYRLKDKVIQDTRGTAGIQALFTSPDAYGAIIGRNPAYIKTHDLSKELPALAAAKVSIDAAQPVIDQIPDEAGIVKQQSFLEGKPNPLSQKSLVSPDPVKQTIKVKGPLWAWPL
ncbi:hypothetical protein AWB71_05989 [Caballeronia peredens]|nr:hypothetical protein AWB71_05989 [Caballeronia peredens]